MSSGTDELFGVSLIVAFIVLIVFLACRAIAISTPVDLGKLEKCKAFCSTNSDLKEFYHYTDKCICVNGAEFKVRN
jgi:hypothetical protein